jgi:uncharacterized protein
MAGSCCLRAGNRRVPRIVLLAFLRLTTRPGLFQKPLSVDAAFDIVDDWLEQRSVTLPEPTARHVQTMCDLISTLGTRGNLTSDAYLAALAIEHGAELCSTDNDFGRFNRLRFRNPLRS